MEVLLNTTWLAVATGAFLFWQAQVEGAARRREHKSRHRLLALSVALVLLFPVISLTDDLHAEQAAMEDSSRSLMKARNMTQGCQGARGSSFMTAATNSPRLATPQGLFSGAVLVVETSVLRLTLVFKHEGRSPPFQI
jgi:cytochrome c oxidase assembly factor CtaG